MLRHASSTSTTSKFEVIRQQRKSTNNSLNQTKDFERHGGGRGGLVVSKCTVYLF